MTGFIGVFYTGNVGPIAIRHSTYYNDIIDLLIYLLSQESMLNLSYCYKSSDVMFIGSIPLVNILLIPHFCGLHYGLNRPTLGS